MRDAPRGTELEGIGTVSDLISERGSLTQADGSPGTRRPAELRRPDRTRAILDAAYELLAEVGYERLTIDAVAARARASKATIYRRWATKQDLVISAFQREERPSPPVGVDAGDLRSDLLALLRLLREMSTPKDARAFVSLLAASQQEPRIADAMRQQHLARWRFECANIIQRARQRGELGATDVTSDTDTIFDLILGQVIVRSVIRAETLDDSFLSHLVETVLLPVLGSRSD